MMDSRTLMKELKRAGWQVVRTRGSHYQLAHHEHAHVVTIPHPKKDLGKGLVHAIRKQAKLEH
jgi:predicted RNA binding protein YcfA (HicA-like mRNA interferase family)